MEYIAVENTGRRTHGRPILRLTRSLHYLPSDRTLISVLVPADFETDFGSVPRMCWRIASPWDALEPTAIHDFLCRHAAVQRNVADWYFLMAMTDYGVVWWRRRLMWLAVRVYSIVTRK